MTRLVMAMVLAGSVWLAGYGMHRRDAASDVALAQALCSPRPPVVIASSLDALGRLSVTVRAGVGAVEQIRFGAAVNGRIDIGDRIGSVGGFTFAPQLPMSPIAFSVRRIRAAEQTMVPMTVVDVCGDWPTFVGGGSAVAISTSEPTATPTPTQTATPTSTPTRIIPTPTVTHAECSHWPAEVVAMLAQLPIPDGVCFKRASAQPAYARGCDRACYIGELREVIYVRSTCPGGEPCVMAHEICHTHQHYWNIRAGVSNRDRVESWVNTPQGIAFASTFNAWQVELQQRGIVLPPQPLYEDFANVCGGWYVRVPGLWNVEEFPSLLVFAREWLPKS